jgi:hypothetical protein
MTLAYDSPERYYAVHVSTSGRVSLRWSEPMATPQDAQSYGRGQVESGNASIAFVVRVQHGRRSVLEKRTTPKSAATAIRHYLDLLDAISEGDR